MEKKELSILLTEARLKHLIIEFVSRQLYVILSADSSLERDYEKERMEELELSIRYFQMNLKDRLDDADIAPFIDKLIIPYVQERRGDPHFLNFN